jgi:predicted dinucleotide-binding enzyme
MEIGIIGSGTVGQHLAVGFRDLGHRVTIGTRTPERLSQWIAAEGKGVRAASPAEAAEGELLAVATAWQGTEAALRSAGIERFAGKVVIDVTNPLAFDAPGRPPKLALGYPQSAGATIQKWLRGAKVVKCFNIITAAYMTDASRAASDPDMFLAGDDAGAKQTVGEIARRWGWSVHDIGGIEMSYILEAFAMLWIVYGFQHNHWGHIFKLMNKE